MGRKPHPRDVFDAEQISRAAYFTVCRIIGRGRCDVQRADTLEAARALRDAAGRDDQGRRPMIYAVTPEGWSIHVS